MKRGHLKNTEDTLWHIAVIFLNFYIESLLIQSLLIMVEGFVYVNDPGSYFYFRAIDPSRVLQGNLVLGRSLSGSIWWLDLHPWDMAGLSLNKQRESLQSIS